MIHRINKWSRDGWPGKPCSSASLLTLRRPAKTLKIRVESFSTSRTRLAEKHLLREFLESSWEPLTRGAL